MTGVEKSRALKKIIFPLAILLLIVIGGAGIYIIVDPDGAMEMIGLRGPESSQAVTQTERNNQTEADTPTFDRRAAAADSARDPRQPRPPTREEIEATVGAPAAEEIINIPISRVGRHIGPTELSAGTEVPRQELYPFAIRRRAYPDAATMAVEFAIRNSSGSHWRNAYLTFRSENHPDAQRFQIEDWQIDETVGIEYRFPISEVTERLAGFRLVGISGQRRESALAELLSQDRNRYLEFALISGQSTQATRRQGDRLTAPGLLGLIGQFQSPMTGIQVRPASMTQARIRVINVSIPNDLRLPPSPEIVLRETSEERREVNAAMATFHQNALKVETTIGALIDLVNGSGSDVIASEAVTGVLQDLRRDLESLNSSGETLARLVRLSRDSEVKRVDPIWIGNSRRIVGQLERVEADIRRVDPTFQIQG